MTEKELYNEYRSCNCKSFTDFLINKIAELKKQLVEKGQLLDLTEREWAKDMSKMIHYKTQSTKANEIIREFVEWATWQGSNCPNFKSIQDKAEQFLSEVEK